MPKFDLGSFENRAPGLHHDSRDVWPNNYVFFHGRHSAYCRPTCMISMLTVMLVIQFKNTTTAFAAQTSVTCYLQHIDMQIRLTPLSSSSEKECQDAMLAYSKRQIHKKNYQSFFVILRKVLCVMNAFIASLSLHFSSSFRPSVA